MTQEEIIEGNKLIAFFMGATERMITNKEYLQGEPSVLPFSFRFQLVLNKPVANGLRDGKLIEL